MARSDRSHLFGNRGFVALLVAQLLGFLNDNIFKMMVSLLAVGMAESGQGGGILSLTSIVFLLPYLLFSGYAGHAADRFGNRFVLVVTKAAELAIILLAIGALWLGRIELLLAILFLLAAQATFFSPAKYSIVGEIAPAAALQRANGLLEISRFGAIVVGTALGGLLLESQADRPGATAAILLGISIAGLSATLWIPRTAAPIEPRRIGINPWSEIAGGLRRIARDQRLKSAVAGLCFFEAVGALLLLDIILIGQDSLRLGGAATGLLGAFVGVGLAAGSLLAGHCARRPVEIGMVPFGVAGVGLTLVLLAVRGHSFAAMVAALPLVGMCGAFCLVPLTAALQRFARPGERGMVIATNNFLCMASVLAVSCGLWLFHQLGGIDPWMVLMLCGVAALAWSVLMLLRFPGYAVAAGSWGRRMLRVLAGRRMPARAGALAVALSCSAGAIHPADAATPPDPVTHRYRVLRSLFGEVGHFQQRLRFDGEQVVVESRLEVRVSLFSAIVLHDVRARVREVWRGGRLVDYHSRTHEDGRVTEIRGVAQDGIFLASGPDGSSTLPADVVPMSPWSTALTRATLLISPETGLPRRVTVARGAPQRLDTADGAVLASHYVARGEESFEVWYGADDQPLKVSIDAAAGTVAFLRQ